LADTYTNRPFTKVGAVLGEVRKDLQVMFEAADKAFVEPQSKGSPNISKQLIKDIEELSGNGVSPSMIARLLGVSRQTVYRWAI